MAASPAVLGLLVKWEVPSFVLLAQFGGRVTTSVGLY